MFPEAGLGQVSLAAGPGSAIHSSARLAASPALLLMPLPFPGQDIKWDAQVASTVVPDCCDKQEVVLHSP